MREKEWEIDGVDYQTHAKIGKCSRSNKARTYESERNETKIPWLLYIHKIGLNVITLDSFLSSSFLIHSLSLDMRCMFAFEWVLCISVLLFSYECECVQFTIAFYLIEKSLAGRITSETLNISEYHVYKFYLIHISIYILNFFHIQMVHTKSFSTNMDFLTDDDPFTKVTRMTWETANIESSNL